MVKEKEFKKYYQNALLDDYKNVIMCVKYLYEKGGVNEVRNYYESSIPKFLLDYEDIGSAKLLFIKAWKKSNPSGYLHKITDNIIKERLCWYNDDFDLITDTKDELTYKINCSFIKGLEKHGKKFKCGFNIAEIFCHHACIPMLEKIFENFLLYLKVEVLKDGCLQKALINKESEKFHADTQ